MKNEKDIQARVEKTLNSLDNVQGASPRPFFFTRVVARLERKDGGEWESLASFIARPAVAIGALTFVILLNAAVFFYRSPESQSLATDQSEQAYTDDYNAVATNFYYDETLSEP